MLGNERLTAGGPEVEPTLGYQLGSTPGTGMYLGAPRKEKVAWEWEPRIQQWRA